MVLDEDVVKQILFLTFSCYFRETEVRQTVQLCADACETGRGRPARPGHSGGQLSDLNGVFPTSPCTPAHPGP